MSEHHRETWTAGDVAWFEYHCFESLESEDATIWLRSHEQVTILSQHPRDDGDDVTRGEPWTFTDRAEAGMPDLYRVRFDGGLEWDVFEDELLTAPAGFHRPDPPRTGH